MPLAKTVTVSPATPPLPIKVGVLSAVILSESETPVSDSGDNAGAVGVTGAVVSIINDASAALASLWLPAISL